MRKLLKFIGLLLLLAVTAVAGYIYLGGNESRDIYRFVPSDFVFMIESEQPVENWKALSKTGIWHFIKQQPYFSDISASTNELDSLLKHNTLLVNMIKVGRMLVSAHVTSRDAYDFLLIVDLKGLGKAGKLEVALENVFKQMGYAVTRSSVYNQPLYELRDNSSGEKLYLATFDNILIASYTQKLVKNAIVQYEQPAITTEPYFNAVAEKISSDGQYQLYVNYRVFDPFLRIFTADPNSTLSQVDSTLSYSAFDTKISDDALQLKGYSKVVDTLPSYFQVFQQVGQGKLLAAEVLPAQTAFFSSIGFDNFGEVYKKFDTYYAQSQPKAYKDLQKNKKRIEKLLDIDVETDIYGWMTEEIVAAVVPADEEGNHFYRYALLHFDDYNLAKEKMDHIAEKIRKKPVLKYSEIHHQGVPIRFLQIEGFFKLFFRKALAGIQLPHYAFVGDYVAFSNDTSSLKLLIDTYIGQQTLEKDPEYQNFVGNFDKRSNVFAWLNMKRYFPYLKKQADYDTRVMLDRNEGYLSAFHQLGFQMSPSGALYSTQMIAGFAAPEALQAQRSAWSTTPKY